MGKVKTLAAGLAVAAVLVVCSDYVAFAATGDSLLLGKVNHAGAVTTIDRTKNGPALSLSTNNDGAAPLVTNGHGKVANLNADRLDGKDSTDFAPAAHGPIAAGSVAAGGNLVSGWGVTNVAWNEDDDRYVFTLPGDQSYLDYALSVTPICASHDIAYGSTDGNLVVYMYNAAGTKVQCGFSFTIVKL
jgi:hypothetical protein